MKILFVSPLLGILALAGCAGSLPVLQWESAAGPYAQNITALTVDERSSSALYAGTSIGEVFQSPDQGMNWQRLHVFPNSPTVHQITQHPEDPARLYACTDAGMHVSSNRGRTWTTVPLEPGTSVQPACRTMVVDPWNPKVMYAGLRGRGISKTSDGGATWFSLNTGTDSRLALGDVLDIKIDLARPDVVYAVVTGMGVLRSTDTGQSWFVVTPGSSGGSASPTRLALHRTTAGLLVYGTSAGSIFRSTSSGEAWSQARQGFEADRILALSSPGGTPDILFAGTETGIYRSTDFGTTWSRFSDRLPAVPTSVLVSGDSVHAGVFAYGAGIGLQMSPDGGLSWRHIDQGLGGATVSLLATAPPTGTLYAATGSTLLRYNAPRRTWETAGAGLYGGSVSSLSMGAESEGTMYATTPAGVFLTSNGGIQWQVFGRTLPMAPSFLDTHPWFKTRLIASGEKGIFYSTNRGVSWSQARPATSPFVIRRLTFTPTNAGFVFAATENAGVVFTSDGGLTWDPKRFGLEPENIVLVTLDEQDPQMCFAWTSTGQCYRSVNRGLEWNRYATPWGEVKNFLIACDRDMPSSVVCLVDGRDVYYSPTGGLTWEPVIEHGAAMNAIALHWNAGQGTMYVGTSDRGVATLWLGETLRHKFGD